MLMTTNSASGAAALQRGDAAQDVVYAWLKQHVLTLPRHETTFLTEAQVCRETGVSRTPVREAFLRLEADGLLRILPKKGAYIAPITEIEVDAIMQARGLVEEWCAQQASRFGVDLAAELDRLIAQQEKVRNDRVAFIESDREFHRAIVRAAGNPVLATFYESLRDKQVRMGVHAISVGRRVDEVLSEHRAIAQAIRTSQADEAAAAVGVHLARTLAALRAPTLGDWSPGSRAVV
ncbi:transcriptional regulator, GntR family [Rhizobium mongolense subsp. loessense]|uniref:Transcriptional regulator, GntR family n=2 Tax=Rhizobium mongolense TaxID=57676 RepID=A0A1G4PRE8_9HYPH|nr:transcriptional regulator, GntR family [Rhizobium mongolense subsp. loessense]